MKKLKFGIRDKNGELIENEIYYQLDMIEKKNVII